MLNELWAGFDALEKVFATCAFAGTLFFLLRMGWSLFAGLDGGDAGDAASDLDSDAHHGDGHDSDHAFKILTVTGLTGFVMMFGWSGLAASAQFGLGAFLSILFSLGAGGFMLILVGYLTQALLKLGSRGACFRLGDCVGRTGSVYLKIPAGGKGKIQITLDDATHEIEAVSADAKEIESFREVEVVRLVDRETVAVKRLGGRS
ncbi:MAG: hypothetical protein M5U26_06330 [Planctomycetota bacterium]|nr:hypothetical protein [Planctomycetota bacterium]